MNSFFEFLAETVKDDMKKHGITKKQIDAATKKLAKEKKVDPKYLKFFAIDNPLRDIIHLYYNIMDPNHKNYKSTITYTL
jgi:hypothetical protein